MEEVYVYENPNKEINKPSKLWYLLPIIFGIVGGLIGYFLIKDKDRKMAKMLVICAIIILAIHLLLAFSVLVFYGLNAPSGYEGPQALGFNDVQVATPLWNIDAVTGDMQISLKNFIKGPITVVSVNGIIDNIKVGWNILGSGDINAFSIDGTDDQKVFNCAISSGTWNSIGAKKGSSYFAHITIYYEYLGQTFSSSGTLRGTYS
jgi:hypothetical protein